LKNANFCSSSRKAKNLTVGIYGIFRGLNFESDAEIGQKGAFSTVSNGVHRAMLHGFPAYARFRHG
jgi:hypothetical protein